MYSRPPGAAAFTAFTPVVPRLEAGLVAEVAVFGPDRFPAFGLPPNWE